MPTPTPRQTLEDICIVIDMKIIIGMPISGAAEIVDAVRIDRERKDRLEYEMFTDDYLRIRRCYEEDKREIMSLIEKPFNHARVARNFFIGAVMGGLGGLLTSSNPGSSALATGILGAGITVFNEYKQYGMDLSLVAQCYAGNALGAFLLTRMDFDMPALLMPLIGGAIGFIFAYSRRREKLTESQVNLNMAQRESRYLTEKNILINDKEKRLYYPQLQ